MSKRNYGHLSQTEKYQSEPQKFGSFFVSKRIFSLFILMLVGVIAFFVVITQKNYFESTYQPLDGVIMGQNNYVGENNRLAERHSQNLSHLADPALELVVVAYDYPKVGRIGEQEATLISWYSLVPNNQAGLRIDFSPQLLLNDIAEQQAVFPNQTLAKAFSNGGSPAIIKALEQVIGQEVDFVIEVSIENLHDFVNMIYPLESQTENLRTESSLSIWQGLQPHGQDMEEISLNQQDFFLASIQKMSGWSEIRKWDEYFDSLHDAVTTNISFNQLIAMRLNNLPQALLEADIHTFSGEKVMHDDKTVERIDEESLDQVRNLINQFHQQQTEN